MPISSTSYNGLKIYFKNDFEVDFLLNEIFEQEPYLFMANNESPLIIDCGAHIGISVLYFKTLYPKAKVIAFEPDRVNFELLRRNIETNNLKDITVYNVAVADFVGNATIYGDFSLNSESVGNTIIKEWGDRENFTSETVPVLKLSSIIENIAVIDYLKIDTEGTELSVLRDIRESLHKVRNIYVEFHEYDGNKNRLSEIEKLLGQANFNISIENIDITKVLSDKYPLWVSRYNPIIHIIKGKR